MSNLQDHVLVPVRNMVNHKVVYTIPDQNRRVVFEPFQERKISAGELRGLHYTSGGETLLHEYLCVKNNDLRAEFNIPKDQIEYDWELKDIKHLLLDNDALIESLQDALDFAPEGIREMIIDYAVIWKIPDTNRRRVISQMTGIDINKQIEFAEATENVRTENEAPSHRRVSATKANRTGRRVTQS